MIVETSGLTFLSPIHQAARIANLPNLLPIGLWIGTRHALITDDPALSFRFAAFERSPRWPNGLVILRGVDAEIPGVLAPDRAHLAFDHEVAKACFPNLWEVGLTVVSLERALPALIPLQPDPSPYLATPEQRALLGADN